MAKGAQLTTRNKLAGRPILIGSSATETALAGAEGAGFPHDPLPS
jgi:hypothetical protein